MKIVLLHEKLDAGSAVDEQDALVQLAFVEAALAESGHVCEPLAIDLDLESARRRLRASRPELVFNLVESLGGSGRLAHLAPALVESLGLPCTGASGAAFLETTDKLRAKRRLAAAGLPTPAWLDADGVPSASKAAFETGAEASAETSVETSVEAGWIVKPVFEDASIDLDDDALVPNAARARARMRTAQRPSFAEAFVDGRELNLALLEKPGGVELLPPAEIRFERWPEGKPRIVGYRAKWHEDSFESRHTPRSFEFTAAEAPLLARVGELARRCWTLFSLGGFARVDFRVDRAGQPWILEVNANPCLSPDAGFAAAASRAGLSGRDVVDRIVAAALAHDRPGERPPLDASRHDRSPDAPVSHE